MSKKLDPELVELISDINTLKENETYARARLTARLLADEILQYLEILNEEENLPINLKELPAEIKKELPKDVTQPLKNLLRLANCKAEGSEKLSEEDNRLIEETCTTLVDWFSK